MRRLDRLRFIDSKNGGQVKSKGTHVHFILTMRQPRLLAARASSTFILSLRSRVVDRRFIFGDLEKEEFIRMVRLYEAFCGVR